MAVINLETRIKASAKTCFDISRSVEAHTDSLAHTNEKVVAGRTSGLFELNDTVTWEANHFGIRQRLTVKITKMEPYTMFEDQMVKGAFKSFAHQHYFEQQGDYTIMKDVFTYEVPGCLPVSLFPLRWQAGIFGRVVDWLFLRRYMTRLLQTRNEAIKRSAESMIE
jgi:ligand-binding SRPBCC domain-containing protein